MYWTIVCKKYVSNYNKHNVFVWINLFEGKQKEQKS